jgi:S-formylglutathione hydrolase FrmB
VSVPSRRALLVGAGAAVGAALGGCSAGPAPTGGGRIVSGTLSSTAMPGGTVGWSIGYPKGSAVGDHLPVVLSLHGRNADHDTTFHALALGRTLSHVVAGGVAPFALVSVDGRAASYWHRRADGTDPQAMIRTDLLPLLARHGLDTTRIGLYGWSMGGYGALLLAETHHPVVRAVAVSSPALFTSAGGTPAGAFDDASDFDRHDVFAHPARLHGIPLRIDCGRSDPFYPATHDFVGRLRPRPAGSFGPGAHTTTYWRGVAPAQLRFLGRHLT